MAEDLLKLLANPTNQAILTLLRVEPTYPRKIGDLLSLAETEVARRLRTMEAAGLVESGWKYIGKNVKLYSLRNDAFTLAVTPEGIRLAASDGEEMATVNPFPMQVPEPVHAIGRAEERRRILKGDVVLVTGIPGIGKTSLVADVVTQASPPGTLFWHTFRGVESMDWLANRLGVFLAQHGDRDLLDMVESDAPLPDRRAGLLAALKGAKQCIVLEDLHRVGDPTVQELLTDAANQGTAGKLVLTSREQIPHNPAAGHIEAIGLQGIGDGDVQALFAAHEVDLPEGLLPRVREELGGHPLAIELFIQTMREKEVEPEALLDRIPEEGLEEYLLQEIHDALDGEERRVLGHASLFRRPLRPDDLSVLSERPVTGPLLHLRRRHLVKAQGDQYTLHEVVRNFAYNLLQDKPRLHERLGRHLEQAEGLESRLEAMHHYLQAGRKGKVLKMVEQDLDLQDFDLVDAGFASLYLETLDAFGQGDVARPRQWALIEDERGDIWYHRGEAERALGHYDAAAAIFQGEGDDRRLADLAWKQALCHRDLGHAEEVARCIDDGLARAEPESQERERLESLKAR